MIKRPIFLTLVLMLVLAFSVNASITVKELIDKAENIVIGKVVDMNAQWNSDNTCINTTVTVDVYEYLKGEAKSKKQTFVIPGGQVNDIELQVPEAPDFSIGETNLLFLASNNANQMSVIGMKCGKFSIERNKVLENGKSIFEFKKEILEHLGKTNSTNFSERIQFPNPELLEQRAHNTIPTNEIIESPTTNVWEYGYVCVWGDDFEGDFPGTDWELYHNNIPELNNAYTWGKTSNNPRGGNNAVWCAQTNLISGNPDLKAGIDNYPNNSQSWMVAGPFDLSDVYSARLSFDIDQTVEPFRDGGPPDWTGVGFSIDGVWFTLGPDFQFFYTSTGGYIHYNINIEDVIGPLWDKTQVWICFIFYSDCQITDKGTWVDNVKLKKYDAHNVNPVIFSVNPAVRSAGTGHSVEIIGNNLVGEHSQESAIVEFFSGFYWWDDTMWVQATEILDWTKERIVCDVPRGASSGKVRVSRHKEGEAYFDFNVPFGYLGFRWYAGVGNASGTDYPIIPYKVNPANPSYDPTQMLYDIVGSAKTWNNNGGAAVKLMCTGLSSATGAQYDGENTVSFDAIYHVPFGTPALTYIWTQAGKILEADIVLNALYNWCHDKSAPPDNYPMVTKHIATNEFGNLLGLADLYGANDVGKTMWGYHDLWAEKFVLNDQGASLEPADKEGVQWIYGTGLNPDFTADSRIGISPLTVKFTNRTKSVYPITKMLWDFGDGSTSEEENPAHEYASEDEARFDVSLTVWADDGSSIIDKKVTENDFVELNVRVAASIDAEPTVGYGPLAVEFSSISLKGNIDSYRWDFGDGTTSNLKAPVHIYENPGVYTVTLAVEGPLGTRTEAVAGLVEVYEDVAQVGLDSNDPAYIGLTDLVLVEGSSCYNEQESWENAIDHDTYHWTGTTSAGKKGDAWAIFKFADESVKQINHLRLMTDTGVPDKQGDWVNRFTVLVSTTGTENTDFTAIGTFEKTTGFWDDYTIDAVEAKYIKLLIESPNYGWRQIGEFEVYEKIEVPELAGSTIEVTSEHIANGYDAALVTINLADENGAPVDNLPASAFKVYALPVSEDGVDGFAAARHFSGDSYQMPVIQSETPGTYYSSITSIFPGEKRIYVRIYNVKLEAPNRVVFTKPVFDKAELALTYGTETWAGEGWDNAIDGVLEGHDGTVSAGPKWKDCYAIFEFADGTTKPIMKYRLLTDTGMEQKNGLVTAYKVYASASGTEEEDFVLVDMRERATGDWEEFIFLPVEVKYIKLVLLEPKKTWRQIGEFEVYTTPLVRANGSAGMATKSGNLAVMPTSYGLEQNYPNPFNPETMIAYQLPEAANIKLRVYNVLGQEIRTLVNMKQAAGFHQIIWDAHDYAGNKVTSGVYFYKLEATSGDKKFSKKMKMTLIR